ncbi:hypothetical protein F4777DRAFT_572340 [Nemania sp. FL0916]|nr:hypothetical protein F4777DRAFT_572340 [Nemania sp. FL0916]
MEMEFPNLGHAVRATFMEDEANVNGVWNSVLSHFFPMSEYIIAPEYWTREHTLRGDLVVLRVSATQVKPVLAFEGKKSGATETTWHAAVEQVKGYCNSNIYKKGGSTFGIVAAGTKFMFVRWDGAQLYRLSTALNDIENTTGLTSAMDITNKDHQTKATDLLNSIRQKPLA